MTEKRVQILIQDFDLVHRDLLIGEEFEMNIDEMNEDESEFLDRHFVELIGVFARKGFEAIPTRSSNTWRNAFKRIACGEYPLEELPEHVRELAARLYYEDKG